VDGAGTEEEEVDACGWSWALGASGSEAVWESIGTVSVKSKSAGTKWRIGFLRSEYRRKCIVLEWTGRETMGHFRKCPTG
jgi:hypothetical protein